MTTTTTATRTDRLPEGLCIVYAHGDISGGLGWKYADGWIYELPELLEDAEDGPMWTISPSEAPDHWGDSMVAIPRDLAEASTDPAVVAWVKSNINQKEK